MFYMKNTSRRNGKVARLPEVVRNQINQMLRDGLPYPAIIQWLSDNGHPGFIPMNLSRWVDGGYGEWLSERERERAHRDRLQWAADLEHKNGSEAMMRANLQMNSIQVIDALSYVDTKTVAEKLTRRPDKFFVMMKTNLKLIEQLRIAENEKRWQQLEKERQERLAQITGTKPPSPNNGP